AQHVVEAEVDIDLLVHRAVERAGARIRRAAAAVGLPGEQHHRRLRIVLADLGELGVPQVLGFLDHHADELPQLVGAAIGWPVARRTDAACRTRSAHQHVDGVGAGQQPDQPQHHHDAEDAAHAAATGASTHGDAQPATATSERTAAEAATEPTAAGSAPVLNVGTLPA